MGDVWRRSVGFLFASDTHTKTYTCVVRFCESKFAICFQIQFTWPRCVVCACIRACLRACVREDQSTSPRNSCTRRWCRKSIGTLDTKYYVCWYYAVCVYIIVFRVFAFRNNGDHTHTNTHELCHALWCTWYFCVSYPIHYNYFKILYIFMRTCYSRSSLGDFHARLFGPHDSLSVPVCAPPIRRRCTQEKDGWGVLLRIVTHVHREMREKTSEWDTRSILLQHHVRIVFFKSFFA